MSCSTYIFTGNQSDRFVAESTFVGESDQSQRTGWQRFRWVAFNFLLLSKMLYENEGKIDGLVSSHITGKYMTIRVKWWLTLV